MKKKVILGSVVAASISGIGSPQAFGADFEVVVVPETAASLGLDYNKMAEALNLPLESEPTHPILVKYHAEENKVDLSTFDGVVVTVDIMSVSNPTENRDGIPSLEDFR